MVPSDIGSLRSVFSIDDYEKYCRSLIPFGYPRTFLFFLFLGNQIYVASVIVCRYKTKLVNASSPSAAGCLPPNSSTEEAQNPKLKQEFLP